MTWAYLDHPTPFGIAHRGGSTGHPENTMAAFAAAVELDYLYIETDVHLSDDGVLVAFHDEDLSRLVGEEAAIGDLSWSDIQQIELEGGHRIPRLEQLFELFTETRFNIDPKSDAAVEPLVEVIQAFDAVERVCIGSFSQDRIDLVRSLLGPELCTSPAPRGALGVVASAILRPGRASPYGCLQIPPQWRGIPLAHPWLIRRIKALGLQVHYWTINHPEEMHRLLDAGADAVITDNIVELLTVLEQRKQRQD